MTNRKPLILIILLIITASLSGQSLVTDRPDKTESAVVVPFSSFQLETGFLFEIDDFSNSWLTNGNLFRYGLSERVELRLAVDVTRLRSALTEETFLSIGDIGLGSKIALIDSDIDLALLGTITFPNGSRPSGNSSVGGSLLLAFSHPLTQKASIGYNAGLASQGYEEYIILWSISAGYGITDQLAFFTEVYSDIEILGDGFVNWDTGFTYLLKENLQADFSFGTGLNSRFNFVSAGISWRIPK